MVKKDERADGLGRGGRQQAAYGELAEVPHMGLQQVFDSRHGNVSEEWCNAAGKQLQCSESRNSPSRNYSELVGNRLTILLSNLLARWATARKALPVLDSAGQRSESMAITQEDAIGLNYQPHKFSNLALVRFEC
jgi:hypothetical protein